MEYKSPLAIDSQLKTLVRQGVSNTVAVFDVSGTKVIPRALLSGHTQYVDNAVFCVDGRRLATHGQEGSVRIWDMGAPIPTEWAKISAVKGQGSQLAFSRDARTLAVQGDRTAIHLWDVSGDEPRERLKFSAPGGWLSAMEFSPDSKTLAVSTDAGVTLFKLAAETPTAVHSMRGYRYAPSALAFSADGAWLATGGTDRTVRTWELTGREPKERPPAPEFLGNAESVVFAPDGRSVVSFAADGIGHVWDSASGAAVASTAMPGAGWSGTFAADGRTLITADSGALVWDMSKQPPSVLSRLEGHNHRGPGNLAVARGGQIVATKGAFPDLRVWDRSGPTPRKIATIERVANGLSIMGNVALSPDGTTLALGTGQFGKSLYLWRVDPIGLTELTFPQLEEVRTLAFSPDSKTLAMSGSTASIELWDLTSPASEPRATLTGHNLPGWSGVVTSIVFDGDGQRIASSGRDGRVILWSTTTGAPLREWRLPSVVHGVTFSADGRHIATANGNGTAYILRIPK
jgi:WD40 repeat protein